MRISLLALPAHLDVLLHRFLDARYKLGRDLLGFSLALRLLPLSLPFALRVLPLPLLLLLPLDRLRRRVQNDFAAPICTQRCGSHVFPPQWGACRTGGTERSYHSIA